MRMSSLESDYGVILVISFTSAFRLAREGA
jgi:hypothetical protein